jgi:hypothetical protein
MAEEDREGSADEGGWRRKSIGETWVDTTSERSSLCGKTKSVFLILKRVVLSDFTKNEET